MNHDFTFVEDRRPVKGGHELLTRILYKGDGIANVVRGFEPSAKGIIEGKKPEDYTQKKDYLSPEQYVKTYGYMAEHRRQWNNGNKINWSENIRVEYERTPIYFEQWHVDDLR